MRVHRILVLLFAVIAAAFMTPTAANALPAALPSVEYPAETTPGSVSSGTVAPGGAVAFSGSGFEPGETVAIYVDGAFIKNVVADANGNFSTTLTLEEAGTASLVARGLVSGATSVATVRVAGSGSDGDDGDDGDDVALPITGTSGQSLQVAIYGGVGAVVLGAALFWFATVRRRRAGPTDLDS